MRVRFVWMVGVGAASVVMPWSTAATQEMQHVAYLQTQPQESQKRSALDAIVSLDFQGTALSVALQAIADQAAMKIAFGGAVTRSKVTVTLKRDRVSAQEGLMLALRGSGFGYRIEGEQVVVEPSEGASKARQTQGTVSGKILHSKTRQPVSGATITLDGAEKGITTGEDGTFRIATTLGEHTLYVRALGFVRQTKKILVEDGTVTVEVLLEPSASVLDEVVVTGSVVATERRAIPTPITVITGEEIERRGITRVEQLLRGEVPGVLALEHGAGIYEGDTLGAMVTARVFSRGVSTLTTTGSTPLKVYVDGVEMLDPSYLGTIDMTSVERIEIITGPQAATLYGSGAMGGVMQVFTKKGSGSRPMETVLGLRYGLMENSLSDGTTPNHFHTLAVRGAVDNGLSYDANLSYRYSGQWQPKLFAQGYGVTIGALWKNAKVSVGGTGSWSYGRNGSMRGEYWALLMPSMRGTAHAHYVARPPSQRVSGNQGDILSFNVDFVQSAMWQQHLTIGRSQNQFFVTPEAPELHNPGDSLYSHQRSFGQRLSFSYSSSILPPRLGLFTNTLAVGFTGSIGKSFRLAGCTAMGGTTDWGSCGYTTSTYEPSGLTVRPTLDTRSMGGFAQWRLGFFDRLYITAGVRGEHNSSYGTKNVVNWTPTTGLAFSFDVGELTVKMLGSYGKATRDPNPAHRDEVFFVSAGSIPNVRLVQKANPFLRPEVSTGPQGGIELFYGNLGSFTVSHYQQKVRDLVQQVTVDTIMFLRLSDGLELVGPVRQFLNIGIVTQKGWETTASLKLGSLNINGSYSWSFSQIQYAQVDGCFQCVTGLIGTAPRGLPTHFANIKAHYAIRHTSVTLSGNWVGKSSFAGNWLSFLRESARDQYDNPRAKSAPGTQAKPGYWKSDLATTHRLTTSVSLLANVNNLANSAGSERLAYYPSLGRITTLGLSLKWPTF